jgi:hypothetical protein
MSLHFFELRKLPEIVNEENKLELWLNLFRAETEEELTVIKAMEVPEMEQAINAYRKITATAEFRELERMRSYARHSEASGCRPPVLLKQARLSITMPFFGLLPCWFYSSAQLDAVLLLGIPCAGRR